MAAFAPPPPAKTGLGYYRNLSPTASVRVSPLCLGAMNFGDSWAHMGKCEEADAMLDTFHENGGNFIDTANNYQKGQSEQILGQWMEKRGVREQMVIATKYTTPYRTGFGDKEIIVNTGGNGTKSLKSSVEWSLKNLRTDYIDLLYVHWWDHTTSIAELMQSLNDLVVAGKVHYLGISDSPAWIVSKANQYARDHGLRQFVVYQGKWSAAIRDFEREIIPMAISEGMALAPWGALGSGHFKTDAQRASTTNGRNFMPPSAKELSVSKALEAIANKKSTAITSIALAYVMAKTPYVFPICGGRTVEQLKSNIEGLSVELTKEDIEDIEKASPLDLGFPHTMIGLGPDGYLNNMGGFCDWVKAPEAIAPRKL
ncbi:probable IN2-2 protein [Phialocephala subalpina]|uniref:Probable IN2-2 protein n=1 Tax=Phialocephala subalpina TaxID=576137 RepID=A0A1L7WBY3_9HELO|nr:probable IN2-2 protein [Phialocephala subalpina]